MDGLRREAQPLADLRRVHLPLVRRHASQSGTGEHFFDAGDELLATPVLKLGGLLTHHTPQRASEGEVGGLAGRAVDAQRVHVGRVARQRRGPRQSDLVVPHEDGFEFKVLITNKCVGAGTVSRFHEGRGAQEGIFGELKTHCATSPVPVRRRLGNQMDLLAGLSAHKLVRELQRPTETRSRGTADGRAALWVFEPLATLRKTLLQRAGRLTRPSGKLTLTVSAAGRVKEKLFDLLDRLGPPA